MSFTHSQQSHVQQTQQGQGLLLPIVIGHPITALPQNANIDCSQSYIQESPILILPDGSLSNSSTPRLPIPHILTPELPPSLDSQTFFSQNTFATSISTLPVLLASNQTNSSQQWHLITKLIITFGPPDSPGGSNNELDTLLSLPNLQNLALIFRDRIHKGRGPASYLRPSLRSILRLKTVRPELDLRLIVLDYVWGEETGVLAVDFERIRDERGNGRVMRDVTLYLEGLSVVEEGEVSWAEGVVERYRGSAASWVGALVDSGVGVSWEEAERIGEGRVRRMVRGWIEEEERTGELADVDVDVEMEMG
ncbi:hypothetical protein BKA64DRAFT_771088 [Cadophora sp. MPI-SDFR-AT-0126]|nr:hypothetical protein BKA64DRAFT_771088 [Leotiomycetes sp. MPI-SDFR-AT-0126]